MCCGLRNFKYFTTLILLFSDLSVWQTYGAEQSTIINPLQKALASSGAPWVVASTYEKPREIPTTIKFRRTTPGWISRPHYCDHMARPCMHAYVTGQICARTLNYAYRTFDTYCMMEYVNCRENYEIWQMVYTGACFEITDITEYIHYPYHDDFFLDMNYVIDDRIVY